MNTKKLLIILALVVIVALLFVFINYRNQQQPMNNQNNSSVTLLSDHVAEFEIPAKYSIIVPKGYAISELPPAGTDFLVGSSYVNCIHKDGTEPKEEKCDVSISSIPESITRGSIEDDLKIAGDSVSQYGKTEFAGNPAYEAVFNLDSFQGYKIILGRSNKRIYSITAMLDSPDKIQTLDQAKGMLTTVQKSILGSFNFVDQQSLSFKLGDIVNYIDHPIISIDDVNIKHIGTRSQPATEQHVRLGDVDSFTVSTINGKSFQIDWSTGTGDLPGPSYFLTNNGCYELNINIIEKDGGKSQSIQNSLVLIKTSNEKCGSFAKDLR